MLDLALLQVCLAGFEKTSCGYHQLVLNLFSYHQCLTPAQAVAQPPPVPEKSSLEPYSHDRSEARPRNPEIDSYGCVQGRLVLGQNTACYWNIPRLLPGVHPPGLIGVISEDAMAKHFKPRHLRLVCWKGPDFEVGCMAGIPYQGLRHFLSPDSAPFCFQKGTSPTQLYGH